MSQSESDICPGSPTSTASISINETVTPPDRTISDVEVLPHKVQLIYHGVDKEPEPFPPPTSPSEQLSHILPTRIQPGTSARASLPTVSTHSAFRFRVPLHPTLVVNTVSAGDMGHGLQ